MEIIGIDGVTIIRWPRAEKSPLLAPKRRAGGGIPLTRAGFMLIAPPFAIAFHGQQMFKVESGWKWVQGQNGWEWVYPLAAIFNLDPFFTQNLLPTTFDWFPGHNSNAKRD